MSYSIWTPAAVWSEAKPWQASAWRIVEAQHVAATLKIVDNLQEQNVLEALLEASKPHLSDGTEHLHYLLSTPFRYPCRAGGSRFRSGRDPGVFYGAQSVRTVAAELGYWRWRFLNDAVDLVKLAPVAHTAFKVDIDTQAVDLRQPPFAVDTNNWTHPLDYSATQTFAQAARETDLGAIVYQSVRDTQPAWCVAVLKPDAFSKPKPHAAMQTWWLVVQADSVIWRREQQAFSFDATNWPTA